MQLIAPDIVAEVCGLSLGVVLAGGAVGFVLWLLGWWSHRFWIVLAVTVLAGVYGLQEAAAFRTNPLAAGMLLAIAAGILALQLARLAAFAVGGFLALVLVQAALPAVEQPLVVFVVGGLASLMLFRWFIMAVSSFAGAALLAYASLGLLHQRGVIDAIAWSDEAAALLNWICGLSAALGFAFQFLFERRARRAGAEGDGEGDGALLGFARLYRRAG
jgi:hypothetical protein